MQERTYTGIPQQTGGNITSPNGMQQYNHNGTQYGQQSQQGGGILKFILGLITGIAVTAPVTTLIVKKVCDNNKEQEVQRAYNIGANDGMQAMAQVAKEEIAKITAEVPNIKFKTTNNEPNASQSPSKAPSSVSEGTNDQDIEEEPREASEGDLEAFKRDLKCSDPFFNGYSEEELMELVDRDLLMDGFSEDSLEAMKKAYEISKGLDCLDTSKDSFMGSTYKMMLYSKADELRMDAVKKAAEKAKENIDKAAKDEKGVSENVSSEADATASADIPVKAVTSDDYSIPVVNYVERDLSNSYNSYFRGTVEDPESREKFEQKMAESMGPPDDEDINSYDLRIDDEEATQEAREFSESRVEYLEMIRQYKNANGEIPPMTISEEQFENEHYLEKSYINWYEADDVFEENDRKIDDPYYHFGFVSGKEMFSPQRTANREDPDICHVRNLKESTDYEITRVHGSYSQLIEDGEVYYHGETNPEY